MMWKKLGKQGLAVKAPWPVAGVEDKILTRQAKLLRDSLKQFRAQMTKAKKGWTKGSIIISDVYPEWKINTLAWMQSQFANGAFPASFMKDLKGWSGSNVTDKKLIKFTMQFASFRKKEVDEVGASAMDMQLPFNQKEMFCSSMDYLKSQLNISDMDVLLLGSDDSSEIPERFSESAEPGKPILWLR